MARTEVTDEQVVKDRLDLEMLERSRLWTQSFRGMRCVMVKKRDSGVYRWTGPCVKWDEGQYVIWARDWSLDDDPCSTELDRTYRKPFEYATAEAIVADGWVVD